MSKPPQGGKGDSGGDTSRGGRAARLREAMGFPLEDWLGTVLMGLLLCLMAANVLLRYAFNTGINWSEEMSRLLLIWIVYLGIASGIRSGAHIRVDLIDRFLHPTATRVVQLCADSLLLVYLGLVIALYVQILARFSGLQSPASGISMAWSYGSVLAGAVLGFLRLVPGLLFPVRASPG